MIDPNDVAVQVCGGAEWITPQLAAWLRLAGFPAKSIRYTAGNSRSQSAAYNEMVAFALGNGGRKAWALFVDRDMRPCVPESMMAILDPPYDLTCVRYPTEHGDASWSKPSCFHTGAWIIRMDRLAKLPRPWFGWVLDRDGQIKGCQCEHLCAQARKVCMSHGHVGFCHHVPRAGAPLASLVIHDDGTVSA